MPDPSVNNTSGFSDSAAVIAAMERYHDAKVVQLENADGESVSVIAMPKGMALQSLKSFLDEYLEFPERRRGTARIYDIRSLVAHCKRFKDDSTVAFANNGERPSITVVYDYHEPRMVAAEDEPEGTMTPGMPDHCQHRAHYEFPLSEQWKAWAEATEPMSQGDFAAFIEDRIEDVVAVDEAQKSESVAAFASLLGVELAGPAKLMGMSRGLSLRVDVKASQHVNLTSGETQLMFSEEHGATSESSSMKVPGGFAIQIPVFKNGALYNIPVRLRYRLNGQRFVWWLGLHNAERVMQHAINEACNDFLHDAQVPLFYGAPES